jgi:hypothetical protein
MQGEGRDVKKFGGCKTIYSQRIEIVIGVYNFMKK